MTNESNATPPLQSPAPQATPSDDARELHELVLAMRATGLSRAEAVAAAKGSLKLRRDLAAPQAARTCKQGDPMCPCPDGDPCHYEGKDAWPAPQAAQQVSVAAADRFAGSKIVAIARNIQHSHWHDGPGDVCIAVQELLDEVAAPLDECGYSGKLERATAQQVAEAKADEDAAMLKAHARALVAVLDQPFRYPNEIKAARDALSAHLGESK